MELAPRSDGTGPRCTKPQHAYWIPEEELEALEAALADRATLLEDARR